MSNGNEAKGSYWMPLSLAILAVIAVAFYFFWPSPPSPGNIDALEENAQKLHNVGGDWCVIKAAWNDVANAIDKLPQAGRPAEKRGLAIKNRDLAKQRCPDGEAPVDRDVKKSDPKTDPKLVVNEEKFREYYRKGKRLRSFANFIVDGKGQSTDWGIKAIQNFRHIYNLTVNSEVLENDGKVMKLRALIANVEKTTAFSTEQFELDPPDSILLKLAWRQMELRDPRVLVVRTTLQVTVGAIDPKFRKTLGLLAPFFVDDKFAKGPFDLQVIAEPGALQGATLEIVYENGFGVTSIQMKDAPKVDRRILWNMAHTATSFVDYHVFPDPEKKPGDSWPVKAEDIAGLFPPSFDHKVTGSFEVKYIKNDKEIAHLEIERGELQLAGRDPGRRESAVLRAKKGTMEVDTKDLTLRSARIDFDAEGKANSVDHFVFPMQKMSDVRVMTRYVAKPPAAKGE